MSVVVVPADAEKRVTDFIRVLSDLAGWSVLTVIPDGITPTNTVQVRTVGGRDGDTLGIADWWRVDVRVWTDGTVKTEGERSRTARMILAHLRAKLRARTFAAPVALPDPADQYKLHTIFTVEILIKGAS